MRKTKKEKQAYLIVKRVYANTIPEALKLERTAPVIEVAMEHVDPAQNVAGFDISVDAEEED